MGKKYTKITVPVELRDKVKNIAKSQHRSMTKQIEHWSDSDNITKNPLPEITKNGV